jgi:hypothetical protein
MFQQVLYRYIDLENKEKLRKLRQLLLLSSLFNINLRDNIYQNLTKEIFVIQYLYIIHDNLTYLRYSEFGKD